MDSRPIRIVLLEDNQADAKLVNRSLMHAGFDFEFFVARSEQEFKSLISGREFDVVLGDYRLPMWTGLEALSWLRDTGHKTPFILVTGTLGDELAVECIKQGAADYILKDHLDRLPHAIERILHESSLLQQRDRAERELRQSEKQYRTIINGAPHGIYKTDYQGNVLMANPAFIAMLGYESEAELQVLNTVKDIYVDPKDREAATSRWNSGEVVRGFQTRFKRKDGSLITVRLAGRKAGEEWYPFVTYEVFVEDITERLLLEEQFQRAQRMEAIGRFAGGIAHDFNNLLMVINSSAELIETSGDRERTLKFTGMIKSAVSKAAGMTRRLLAFSRQQMLNPVSVSLNEVVTDLCKMLPQLLGEDIKLKLELAPDLGTVRVDRSQMDQVLMNLAVNARDAMPSGGTLTLETRNVELDSAYPIRKGVQIEPGLYVVLAVTDTGIGMDQQTQERIFEPFFTTKEPGKGTGLGLASVYGIVKQSGGFIWVYSESGKGTTFKVYLPIVGEAPEKSDATAPQAATGGNETILLVEDEPMLRRMMVDFLHAKGYEVIEAENGIDALQKVEAGRPHLHLVITDVVMPDLGGPALVEKLRPQFDDLRVIYVSGYADRNPQHLDSKSFLYLQKPFGLEVLAQTVRTCLSGEKS